MLEVESSVRIQTVDAHEVLDAARTMAALHEHDEVHGLRDKL